MKRCSTCKTVKDREDFPRNRANKDGLDYVCRDCRREYNRKYRENNPHYSTEYKRRMRAAKKNGSWEPRKYGVGRDTQTNTRDAHRGVQTPQRGR